MKYLQAPVPEQGAALEELRRETADAEERRKASHEELMGMITTLSEKNSLDRRVQEETGGRQELTTKGAAGSEVAPPPSEAGAGRWGGERPSNTNDGLGGRLFVGQPRMTVPILKVRENFENFSKQMKVYATLHCFDTVFEHDPYIVVGADASSKTSLMALGVSAAMYERQLVAWVFLSQSLKSDVDEAKFHRSASPRKCWEEVVEWYDTKTNRQKVACMRQLHNFKLGKQDDPVEKFYEIEDLRVKLNHAGISVDDDTLYS